MNDISTKPDHQRLFEIASEQGGYFTATQARSSGFSWALLTHHSKSGRFIRIRRGLYRLREYPSSSREDVLAAWLGADANVAVVSHESALELHELSDVVPEAVHLSLPRSKRYRSATPGVAIHTTTRLFAPNDITVLNGIRVTSAARSIMDAAEIGTAPEQILAAVAQALQRGLATKQQILALGRRRGARVERLIRQALEPGER